MRSIDEKFYKSKEWKRCRELYLSSVNHICERCAKDGKIKPARFVHHKIYMNERTVRDPRLALGFDNLEALCYDCHNAEHFGDKKKIVRWRFEDGEISTTDRLE